MLKFSELVSFYLLHHHGDHLQGEGQRQREASLPNGEQGQVAEERPEDSHICLNFNPLQTQIPKC